MKIKVLKKIKKGLKFLKIIIQKRKAKNFFIFA
jgi:hypothetical protein